MGCFLSLLRHSNSPFKRCFSRRRPIFFKGPARRQNFGLPGPIMYYIVKNISSANVHRKLVKSCKYFFIENPVIVVACLHMMDDGWSTTCLIDKKGWSTCITGKKGFEKFDMEKIPTKTKLWLFTKFNTCEKFNQSETPTLIAKFYRIESRKINCHDSTLTFEKIGILASRYTIRLHLLNCIVQYEKWESVQLETLIAQFPLLEYFFNGSNISTNTVKELLSNPNFSKMKAFHLIQIPDTFDIDSFYAYLKSRDDFYCCLCFRSDISADYQERLQVIIDELLATESTSFRFPSIHFYDMHPETRNAIKKRYEEDCDRRNIKPVILNL